MRQLFPPSAEAGEVDLAEQYASPHRPMVGNRPWCLLNMVASVDGATAIDGVSGGLGGEGDRMAFGAIRGVPDAIIAAAGTVRAEHYRSPDPSAATRERRVGRGLDPVPQLVIVTGSVDLDPTSPVFTAAERPPVVVTIDTADPARVRAVTEAGAIVVTAGAERVDATAMLVHLAVMGHRVVLLEGGPSLNGQVVAADLIDEVCLTMAPKLVGGRAARLAHGDDAVDHDFALAHLLEHDGELLCRYVRARHDPG